MSTHIVAAGHPALPAPGAHELDPLGNRRSPEWPSVRKHHLALHPTCAVCGVHDDNDVHHCEPFHIDKSKELDESNLITLCRVHHFWWGHLGNWSSFNVTVRQDAEAWRLKIVNRPKPDPTNKAA